MRRSSQANKHDLTIVKERRRGERKDDFAGRLRERTVLLDKAYADEEFSEPEKMLCGLITNFGLLVLLKPLQGSTFEG
ncbi:hypothetical protein KEJ19_03860 [Candidatus Bathyarchaeota archaeon]|nr:hypothetical protein [Candidatus Bathyarchaeota archaeon]